MPDAWMGPANHPGAELGYVAGDSAAGAGANQEYSPYTSVTGAGAGVGAGMRDSKLARYHDESRRTTSAGSGSGVGMSLLGGMSPGPSTPGWNHEGGEGRPGDDIIIQHRDAGGVGVTEVPPPYLDHRSSVADTSDAGGASSVAGASSSGGAHGAAGPSNPNAMGGFHLSPPGPSNAASSSRNSYTPSSNEKSEKFLL